MMIAKAKSNAPPPLASDASAMSQMLRRAIVQIICGVAFVEREVPVDIMISLLRSDTRQATKMIAKAKSNAPPPLASDASAMSLRSPYATHSAM